MFLGIDLGTSYFKAGLFDAGGNMLGFAKSALPKKSGDNISQVHHIDFLNTIKWCVHKATDDARIDIKNITALSYGAQANSYILLDEHGKELSPFILWNDEQAPLTEEIKSFANNDFFIPTTGIGINISNQFLINKLNYLQTRPIAKQASHILTMPDYLCYKLTNEKIIDTSTLSLTGLLDYKEGNWWHQAVEAAGINIKQLSRVMPVGTVAAYVNKQDNFLALNKGVKFCSGGLDHHIAAIGAGVGRFFNFSESTGTVIAAVKHSADGALAKNVCVSKGFTDGAFFKMAFNENGATALEWYQKKYAPEYALEALINMAEKIPQGSMKLAALPCPQTYPGKLGFKNVDAFHHHGHFVRAIMESTAQSLSQLLNTLHISPYEKIVSTGGGAKSKLWRQIKKTITSHNLVSPAHPEAACIGAAMLAATADGSFENLYQTQQNWLAEKKIYE